jgi:2,4-dienoyl-CoA reductase-like NADH-dependent reductase (Old Yellow Enzyme family)/thioredoxin reductase
LSKNWRDRYFLKTINEKLITEDLKMDNNFKHLFSPIKIGNFTCPNRLTHVATDSGGSFADGEISDRDIYHHSQIAKGGTGFIIVGAVQPDSKTGKSTINCVVADDDKYIPGLARLAESMHRYGAKCAVQLQHPGRQGAAPRYPMISVSDMVIKLPWSQSHEIVYENAEALGKGVKATSIEEILNLVELFSDAAWRVKQAGFDCVQLHAAHGYLISAFMSPYLNKRNDRFGGSLENRLRFPLDIVRSIQKKCGKEYPISIRYSGDEYVPGGRGLEESIEVAKIFEEAGVALLDISECIQESPGAGFDPMYYPEGWSTFHAEAIKKVVGIPVITSHSLRSPEYCDKIIRENKTDMVGLSRQLLADQFWGVKAKMGKVDEIRKCISCLTACWQESHMAKKEVGCAINPSTGDESFAMMKKSKTPVKLAIVGGGPAGLEAARIAAVRGHDVTLFEKTQELGGAILGCCMVPGKEKMKWFADWARCQVYKFDNIKVRLSHVPSLAELKKFDVILNATGASSYVPDMFGDMKSVVPFEEVMACPKVKCEYYPGDRKPTKVGERVLIWGDHYAAVDTAQYLASIGKQVTILTENHWFAEKVEVIHMYVARLRFKQQEAEALEPKPYKHPVNIIEDSTVLSALKDKVIIQDKAFNKSTLRIDSIVSCHVRPNNVFFEEMKAAGLKAVNVGDSVSVRNLHAAVKEGAIFAKNLEGHALFNSNGAPMNELPLDLEVMLT